MQTNSSGLILLDIILYLVAVFFSRKKAYNNSYQLILAYSATLFFCLYAAWGGDYFHYLDDFELVKRCFQVNLEPVYYSIIQHVGSFFQFRFIVWGGALFLFYLASRYAKVDKSLVLFCLVLCFLPRFSYARASLAMSLLTLGCIIICKDQKIKLFHYLLGILIIFSSFAFHKSAFWGVLMILLAVIFYKRMSVKTMVLLSVISPGVIIALVAIITKIMAINVDVDDTIIYAGQKYLGAELGAKRGWGQVIEELLMRLSFYMVAILFILSVARRHYDSMPKHIKVLSCTSFFTIVLSSAFAFDLGYATQVIYNRFLYYAQLPSAFFVAYCITTGFARKWVRVVLYTGAFAALYALIYSYYCSQFG